MSLITLPRSRLSNRPVTTPMDCKSSRSISASPAFNLILAKSVMGFSFPLGRNICTLFISSTLRLRLPGYTIRKGDNCCLSNTVPTIFPSRADCNWYCRPAAVIPYWARITLLGSIEIDGPAITMPSNTSAVPLTLLINSAAWRESSCSFF